MSFIATAVFGGGALSAGASIFGAETQASAQKQAAGTISSSTQSAIQQLLGLVGQGQGAISGYTGQGAQALTDLIGPFAQLGKTAGGTLMDLLTPGKAMDVLREQPGYRFALDTGEGAINNAATTSGLGGNVLTAGANYAGGVAQNTYGTLLTALQSMLGTGASAASTGGASLASLFGGAGQSIGSLLGQGGQTIGNLTSAAGQNIAQTQVGAANAIAGGAQGVGSSLLNSLLMGKVAGGLFGK